MTDVADLRLFIGTYTGSSGGHATGIEYTEGAAATTVAVVNDPSFLAVTGDRLYAVSEGEFGRIHAFRRDGNALEHLWEASSGGNAPCHIRLDAAGVLVVTNYVSGTVSVFSAAAAEANPESVVGAETSLPFGTGPVADRQDGPHAHQSLATAEGTVLVTDLGTDAIYEFRVTEAPELELVAVHPMAPGVGPRHMAWVDGDLLVAGELDCAVHRLRRSGSGGSAGDASGAGSAGDASGASAGAAESAGAGSAGAESSAVGLFEEIASARAFDGEVGESTLSHIEVGPTGLVYVAARGRDTIAVFDASNGSVERVGESSSGGRCPRHFAIVGDLIVVANQLSDQLSVLRIGEDGLPSEPIAQIAARTPTCVVSVG